jgi:hypothetical protein
MGFQRFVLAQPRKEETAGVPGERCAETDRRLEAHRARVGECRDELLFGMQANFE